jgi:hypothetical protein
LMGRLDAKLKERVQPVSDISACEEIIWSEIADFYFCHGGTMQNKIGWIHGTPGMLVSNSKFIASYRSSPSPVEGNPEVYYLPETLIADDADANYAPEQLARKDQNFTLLSPREAARQLLDKYRDSQKSRDRHRADGSDSGANSRGIGTLAEPPTGGRLSVAGVDATPAPATGTARPAGFFKIHAFTDTDDPVAGLADIWMRLRAILRHMQHLDQDETAIQRQQHGIVRDGCFLLPSPFRTSLIAVMNRTTWNIASGTALSREKNIFG